MSQSQRADVAALLEESGALLSGHFKLSSGLHSPNYVQCALLLEHPRYARAIGEQLAALVRPFDVTRVVAPALGGVIIGHEVAEASGVPFAFAERREGVMTLRRGFRLGARERVVVVEDVVTTGRSSKETAVVVEAQGAVVAAFASILNRSGAANPFAAIGTPYVSLMALALETHEPGSCPLCAQGIPLDAPGSRFSGRV